MIGVYSSIKDLPGDLRLDQLQRLPLPTQVLMCPPDHFDVVDEKNPFMKDQKGNIRHTEASKQWEALKDTFAEIGLKVHVIPPLDGREDMVFCANQTFVGLDAHNKTTCILSHMKYPSRQKEVPAFADWFSKHGYTIKPLDNPATLFEGCGDALWHPQRRLIWGGYGHRTEPEVYSFVSRTFSAPVLALKLKSDNFYHLDTCFCPIDPQTVLVYPPALTDDGLELIHTFFSTVIPVEKEEAIDSMACNAAAFFNKDVVIQKGAKKVNALMKKQGFIVHEVETGEFMKSGGSVFCMKMAMY